VIDNIRLHILDSKIKNFEVVELRKDTYSISIDLNDVNILDSISKIIEIIETIPYISTYTYNIKSSVKIESNQPKLVFEIKKINTQSTQPIISTKSTGTHRPSRSNSEIKDKRYLDEIDVEKRRELLSNLEKVEFTSYELNHIDRIIRDRIPYQDNYYIKGPGLATSTGVKFKYNWNNYNRNIDIRKFEKGKFVVDVTTSSNMVTRYYLCNGIEDIRKINFA
jgi:hypothetical protein